MLAFVLLLPFNVAAQKTGSPTSSSSKTASSKSTKSTSGKTVHVKEYKRKDGTVVKAHDRAVPGTTAKATPSIKVASGKARIPKKSTVAQRNANGRIARSATAKKTFMTKTGYAKGRTGYVVDHIVPLECGGADIPSNMQWQPIQEAKIKDRTERNCRRE